MKATDFLTWFNRAIESQTLNDSEKLITKASYLSQALYSTPFKPEHITEFFEGWELSTVDGENNYRSKSDHVRIWLYTDYDQKIMRLKKYPVDKHHTVIDFQRPQTLNDFISDCQRAGIELTFKPEIVERYFK